MPKYRFTAPNGKDYLVSANSPEEAQAGFAETVRQSPMMYQKPGVAAALRALEKQPPVNALTQRAADAATLGLSGVVNRGLGAGITAVQRAVPGGVEPKYTPSEMYEAQRLREANLREKYAAEHPGLAFGADVLGSFAMPGMGKVAGFIEGRIPSLMAQGAKIPASAKAAALARTAVVGGGMGAVLGATQSRQGEAGSRAVSEGLKAAALAPVVALGGNAVVRGGQAAYNVGKRLLSPPTTSMAAVEKLVKVLQNAEVDPRMIDAAITDLQTSGGLSPSVYEVLRKSGASPDVLRFFANKGAYPATREAAEKYATAVTQGTQGEVLKATEALPGGGGRTPAEIRADYDARVAAVTKPPAGAPREEGAQALYVDLNRKRDVLSDIEKQGYDAYAAAHPESAVIDDAERSPLITNIYKNMSIEPNPHIPAWKRITSLIEGIRTGYAPEVAPRLPELPAKVTAQLDAIDNPQVRAAVEAKYRADAGLDVPVVPKDAIPDNARPLTVKDLDQRRRALVAMQGENLPNEVLYAAGQAKRALDAEIERLATEGKIQGDPEVVNRLNEAIFASADLRKKFGDGLAATLTERTPSNPNATVIKPYQVGDVIFGKGETPRNLNDILADVEPIMAFADPGAIQSVKSELYSRVPGAKLPEIEQRFSMSAPEMVPPELSAQAAAARNEAAQLAAEQQGVTSALDIGAKVRSEPSTAFAAQVQGLPAANQGFAQTAARQHLLDVLENPPPETTGLLDQLQSARATSNLPEVFGTDAANTYQRQLAALKARAQSAKELESALGGQTPVDKTFLEDLTPRDVLSGRYATADLLLKKMRSGIKLSPDESLELFNFMKSENAPDLQSLSNMLKVREVSAPAGLKAAVTQGFAAPQGNAEELERMRTQYGLIY